MVKEKSTKITDDALTDQHYWAERFLPRDLKPDSSLEPYLSHLLPVRDAWTVLEIGVVPGNVLLWFANRFRYKPVGLDFSGDLDSLQEKFATHGAVGRFIKTDFLTWNSDEQFNVVYSGGFIEHFSNYQAILTRHWNLIMPGGYLIVTVPLLSPVQMGIRKLVWRKEQLTKILMSHNQNAMNLDNLQQAVMSLPGANILSARPILEMTCWINPDGPGVRRGTWPILFFVRLSQQLFKRVKWSSEWFSPMLLVVAQKNE